MADEAEKVPFLSKNTHFEDTTEHPSDNQGKVNIPLKPSTSSSTRPSRPAKKKQPIFLEREIKITNIEDVKSADLLNYLHNRFHTGYQHWLKRAKVFKFANLVVTLLVISIQLLQVILFQVPDVSNNVQKMLATVLPALTGAVLAIQLKLGWSDKGTKCKKSAKLYSSLANHVEFRLEMLKAGGKPLDDDVVKLWNTALLSEMKDIPSFLLGY